MNPDARIKDTIASFTNADACFKNQVTKTRKYSRSFKALHLSLGDLFDPPIDASASFLLHPVYFRRPVKIDVHCFPAFRLIG
jgi:hypothetical protein